MATRTIDGRWIRVCLPTAAFAIVVRDGRVVDAAPYGRRYIGMQERQVAALLLRAGATFTAVSDQKEGREA